MFKPTFNDSVFINCPFDDDYKPILRAIVYAIYRCGFFPQTALDEDDGTELRLLKIIRKMKGCRYGIHDLSRIELNNANFPRFNMPFELGIFFGAKYFGGNPQNGKNALITIPGEKVLQTKFEEFERVLPNLLAKTGYSLENLPFLNFLDIVQASVAERLN
jgi:hypothetical protein